MHQGGRHLVSLSTSVAAASRRAPCPGGAAMSVARRPDKTVEVIADNLGACMVVPATSVRAWHSRQDRLVGRKTTRNRFRSWPWSWRSGAACACCCSWAQPPRLTTPRIGPPALHHHQPITITTLPIARALANHYSVRPKIYNTFYYYF